MRIIRFDIHEILNQSVGASLGFEINQEFLSPDRTIFEITKPIRGNAEFIKLNKGVLGKFEIETQIELICARCAKKFKMPIELKFEQEFWHAGGQEKAFEKLNQESPNILFTIDNNVLDFTESLEQELLLTVPLKPLCKENCKLKKVVIKN
jgi:uncharacterized protein